ncbi:MAG: TolC family protein, partial [Cyanobacteria bacterium REEB65]|nr:TolC family protein [Cyanobacteria bacterium REEB65]
VLQADAQVAAEEGQLRSAQNTLDLARLQLANLLGEPLGSRTVDPAAQVPTARIGSAVNLTSLVDCRPEVQTLLLDRRIQEATVDLDRKANYPKAQVQAQYSQYTFTSGRSFMVDAGLSWPLVDWGKADQKARSAELDLRQTDLQLAQARRNLATDIEGAILSRQDARDRVHIAVRGLQSAQEAYRMAEVRYRAGVGTGYEVIDAQTALLSAQITYVQASYQLQASEIQLAQALNVDLYPSDPHGGAQ